MNYIKIKNAQTLGSVTKNIDFIIPVDSIAYVTGTTTSVIISTNIGDAVAGNGFLEHSIGGFGTLSSASDGFQTVYKLIEELAKTPNTVSDYLKVNGDDLLTVVSEFA
jgi:hypothetical protein